MNDLIVNAVKCPFNYLPHLLALIHNNTSHSSQTVATTLCYPPVLCRSTNKVVFSVTLTDVPAGDSIPPVLASNIDKFTDRQSKASDLS